MTVATVKGFPSTSGDDYPLNLLAFLQHAARTYPEVEVVSRRLDGSLVRSTYGEVYRRVCRLANALRKLGVRPGDRIGALDWNTHRYLESYFAVAGLGAVLLQVNPRISAAERRYVLEHSGARFLLVSESLLPVIEPLAGDLAGVEGYVVLGDGDAGGVRTRLSPVYGYEDLLADAPEEIGWPAVDETSAATACYTSGTTGRPKGVYHSHRALYLHTLTMALMVGLRARDVVMQTVPMFHAQGWGLFFCAPLAGATLVLPGRYTLEDPSPLVGLLVAEKVTVTCGAPAIFLPMLEHLRRLDPKPDLSGLRMLSGATEPPLSMMRGFWELGGAEVIHAYGATETAPLATMNLLKPSLEGLGVEERWDLRRKQGLPVCGIDLKVVTPDGREAPADGKTVGEVWIRGPWVTTSYHNDERTAEAFSEGYWRSGDAGTIDPNGYLKITDRFKDLIKSGGEWISSIDLENAIMAHPLVKEAAVIGVPHPKWEERPLALVVLQEGAKGQVSEQEIRESLLPRFARWQLPDEVLFVDEIPKTSVGKFAKRVLRDIYRNRYGGGPER